MLAFVVNRLQEAHPGRWRTPAGIGVRAGKVTSKPKVGKIEKITTLTAVRRQAFALFGARPDHPGADTTTAPGTVSPAQQGVIAPRQTRLRARPARAAVT